MGTGKGVTEGPPEVPPLPGAGLGVAIGVGVGLVWGLGTVKPTYWGSE